MLKFVPRTDSEIADAINNELNRLRDGLEMIPSENYASPAVLEAMGTVLSNKYAEGYPGKRYYGGNQFIDVVEGLAIERAKKLFNAEHANVQPNIGSVANMAAYFALTDWGKKGNRLMGIELSHGGHLTHGSPVNFSGKLFQVFPYYVDKETHLIDFERMRNDAIREKPNIIVSGATAYPRLFDFKVFKEIADEVGAYFVADIAHIAGLIVAGVHPDPVPYADIVTTTTHKTLRGPRGAIILCKADFAQAVDKVIFPGLQGGPLEHVIAAKAVCFKEAMQPEFKEYGKQIVKNAKTLAETLMEHGLKLISGGTDNHLILVDVTLKNITGKQAETVLDEVHITVNKNMIPYDKRKPMDPSGIRLGTPAITTRGMKESEMKLIGELIARVLDAPDNEEVKKNVKEEVVELCRQFPLYPELG